MFNDFQFRNSKQQPKGKEAVPSFNVGDIRPRVGWCLVEMVKPPKPDGEEKSRILTKGKVRTPDGQLVAIHGDRPKDKNSLGDMMQNELWRIVATGSDYFIEGGEVVPFPFREGDECILSVLALGTAHGLQYPDDQGEKDERPTRILVQMDYFLGCKTRSDGEVHGDDG